MQRQLLLQAILRAKAKSPAGGNLTAKKARVLPSTEKAKKGTGQAAKKKPIEPVKNRDAMPQQPPVFNRHESRKTATGQPEKNTES